MDTLNSGTKLINKSDIRRALPVKGPLGSLIASCAMSLLGLNRINRLYPQFGAYRGREFTKEAMKTFRISTDILPEEVEYIPREGPFIIVSNHPFGGWDGIVLYNTVAAVRPDFRILTNFILSLIPNLRDSFLAVNPFSDRKQLRSSLPGLKAAMETIERGGCVGIFPAGEVSTYYRGNKFPADKEWTHTVMKLVTTCRVPVLPVYFDGGNSRLFHLLGRIHPMLRTLRLPRELLRRSDVSSRPGKSPNGRIRRNSDACSAAGSMPWRPMSPATNPGSRRQPHRSHCSLPYQLLFYARRWRLSPLCSRLPNSNVSWRTLHRYHT